MLSIFLGCHVTSRSDVCTASEFSGARLNQARPASDNEPVPWGLQPLDLAHGPSPCQARPAASSPVLAPHSAHAKTATERAPCKPISLRGPRNHSASQRLAEGSRDSGTLGSRTPCSHTQNLPRTASQQALACEQSCQQQRAHARQTKQRISKDSSDDGNSQADTQASKDAGKPRSAQAGPH